MATKSLRQFLKEHRDEIDCAILKANPNKWPRLNDHERRLWILNDEGLY